ncbi:MAG TPA: metal ABC transporter permease [Thiolapillus brandeum]|uniref:Metal ABC transporter permease n=1 Tax=Thiolapillus brandeum TaxID=1076588 RepID=A0A831NZB1_9GAMM|nr:metal ABC transporter permease [Thiolapillus brandeum]
MDTFLQYSFLQTALIAGLLASIGCGVMGSYVVVKRIGYMAGGISHSVLAGMGAALFFGFAPMQGALLAALFAALLIGWIKLKWQTQEDTLIGAMWAIGMSIGVLFISRTPGYSTDLMSYLFGNILLVSADQLWEMAALNLLVIGMVLAFYRQFLAVSFDEEFARLRGVPVNLFYLLFLCLVALTVVLLVQVVGLILVIALLTLPAAIAGHYVHTMGRMMILASLLGMGFTSIGIWLSYVLDLPTGAVIILAAGASYILSAIFSQWWQQAKAQRASA